MPGAIVPDDWDGSTYQCLQVIWPNSEKYRALLLGQMSEGASVAFWDNATGDEVEASDALENAYKQTVSQPGWPLECEAMTFPIRQFQLVRSGTQALAAGTPTYVEFNAIDHDNWGLELTPMQQQFPMPDSGLGFTNDYWHFSGMASLNSPSLPMTMQLTVNGTAVLSLDRLNGYAVGSKVVQIEPGALIGVRVTSATATAIRSGVAFTSLSGHRVNMD